MNRGSGFALGFCAIRKNGDQKEQHRPTKEIPMAALHFIQQGIIFFPGGMKLSFFANDSFIVYFFYHIAYFREMISDFQICI
jgi:hypothetical protein